MKSVNNHHLMSDCEERYRREGYGQSREGPKGLPLSTFYAAVREALVPVLSKSRQGTQIGYATGYVGLYRYLMRKKV